MPPSKNPSASSNDPAVRNPAPGKRNRSGTAVLGYAEELPLWIAAERVREDAGFGGCPPPPDQVERDRISHELDTTMLVEAAAGTGKTTSMIGRMLALLREGKCRIDTLAAVTFTRKAAAELR